MISRGSLLLLLFTAGTSSAFADQFPIYTATSLTITYTTPAAQGCCASLTRDSWSFSGPGITAVGGGDTYESFYGGQVFLGSPDDVAEQGTLTIAGQQYAPVLFYGDVAYGAGAFSTPASSGNPGQVITVSTPAAVSGSLAACVPLEPCEGALSGPFTYLGNIEFNLYGTLTSTFQVDRVNPSYVDLLTAQFVSTPEPAPGPAILVALVVFTIFFCIRHRRVRV